MKIKRMLAMLLTLAMLFTMASPALAEGDVLPETNEFAELIYEDEDLEANEADDDLWEVEAADESGASLVEAPEEAVSEIEALALTSLTEEGLEAVDEEPAEEEEETAEEESVSDVAGMVVAATIYGNKGGDLTNEQTILDRSWPYLHFRWTNDGTNWTDQSCTNKSINDGINTDAVQSGFTDGVVQLIYAKDADTTLQGCIAADAFVNGSPYPTFADAVAAQDASNPIVPVKTSLRYEMKSGDTLYVKDAAGFNPTITAPTNYVVDASTDPTTGITTYKLKLDPALHTLTVVFHPNCTSATQQTMDNQVIKGSDATKTLTKNTFTRDGYVFDKWNTLDNGNGSDYADEQDVSNVVAQYDSLTLNLYAQWTGKKVTAKFDANGGEGTLADQDLVYGTTVNLTANNNAIKRTGYTFAGWNTVAEPTAADPGIAVADSGDASDAIVAATGTTVTFYAQWTPKTLTVHFGNNSGSGDPMADQTFTYGDSQTLNDCTFTKSCHHFDGWKYDANNTVYPAGTTGDALIEAIGQGTVTLAAQWAANSVTVEFYPNGGEGDKITKTMVYGDGQTLANTFKNPGYIFSSWNTQEDGNGTSYPATSTSNAVTGENGVTIQLYAQWGTKTLTAIYEAGEGTGTQMENQTFVTGDGQTMSDCTYTKGCYHFTGWKNNNTVYPVTTTGDDLIKTLGQGTYYFTAQWEKNSVTVQFDGNGGTSETGMSPMSMTYGDGQKLTKNNFTRDRYTFAGWNTAADGSGTSYVDEAGSNALTGEHGVTITLYAQWTGLKYKIVYDGNGATAGSMSNQNDIEFGKGTTLKRNEFTRDYYHFVGWNTVANPTEADPGVELADEDEADKAYVDGGNRFVLYAQWAPNTATITFDPNGGTGSMDPQTVKYAANGKWTPNKNADDEGKALITYEGRVFVGWNTAADGNGTSYKEGQEYEVTALVDKVDADTPVTLYAVWENAKYEIVFHTNASDATGEMAPMHGCESNTDVKLPACGFTRPHYTFLGWTLEPGEKTPEYKDGANINLAIDNGEVVHLYAQWEAFKYNVQFYQNADDPNLVYENLNRQFTYDGDSNVLPAAQELEGFAFVGWSTVPNPGDNDPIYPAGATVTENFTDDPATIVKFYAIWDGNTYPVHFEPNVPEDEEGNRDYEGAMSDVDFVFGEKNPLPEVGFRRNGYKFVGWTTVPGGLVPEYTGTEVDKDLPLNQDGVAVLYAVWEYNVYHVEFDRNGENVRGETDEQDFTLGESKALNANGFINEHYVFEGWSLKKNPAASETKIADQANVKDTDLGNPKADDTVILYAQWKLEEFKITWKNDDGSKLPEATSAPTVWEYGKRPVYPGAKNPESSHKNDDDFSYTFVGWKDKTEQLWTGDLPIATEDATYTAVYDVKSRFYTMSFMDDGKPLAVLTQAEGTPITPPADPTKDGYEFTGWKNADATSKYQTVPAKMPAEDLTFEAQWNKVLTIKDVRIEPQEYTGSALTPVETVTYQGQPLTKDTHYTVTLPEGRCVDAGEYDVTITGIGDYTGTVVAKFIIYPKGNIVVTAVEQTKKYGDPDPQLTYTVKIGDKTYTNNEPEAAKAVSGKLDREPGEDVGIYAITQGTLKGNPNYEITFVGNYLEITKADSFVIDEPIGKTELVYDGTDQPLVKAGTAEGGMLQYSLDGVNFSTTIPTGNDAGTYPVYYKVEGDKNHNDTKPVEIKVTIAPKPVIVTGVKADDKVYDGSARTTITGTPIMRGLATGDIVVVMPGEANFIDGKAGYEKLVRYSGFTLTDVDAKNYVLQAQPAPTTANIIPKNVSLSWGDPELIYNGQYQAPEAKIEGVVEGDDCSVKVEGKQKDVGEYTASAAGLTGKDKSNYKVVSTITTTPYTIGQKSVTITGLTAKDKVYDGNTEAVILGLEKAVIDGKESGDIVTAVPGYATFDDANVGENKVVTFDGFTLGGRDAYNYILSAQPAAVKANITQKEVGLTWTDTEFVYDGKAHQPTATATGLVAGDTCEVKVTGAQTAAGTYTATATSLSNPNYKLPADPTTQFTIGKKEVTITADAKTKVYGSADPALTYTVEGLVKGEKLTGELKRKEGENVGTYAIEQYTLKASDNYDVTYVGADFTITKKALTVKADAQKKVYGEDDPALTYSVSGLVKEEDKVTGKLEREPGENVGKYAIKQGTLTAGDNYDMTFIGADLTITQKDLTVVADAKSKTYGDKDPEFTYTVTGLVGFDEMTGALTREPGENVGTYAILQGTLTAGGNYKLHYKGANLTIGKKALKVKADAQSKIYGEKDPELTYSVEGLVSGDKLTGALTRAKGENVGTYAITQGSLTAGGNYNLSFTGSTLTISRKALTVKADAKSKTYGDKDPEFTYVATGLVGNETLTGALSRVSGENVGKYAIQQGTLKASDNYTLTFIGADLTILPKKIVPTMDLDPERFVYDSQPKEPKVTVMDGDEEVPETEYTVEYEDNIEPGTGKARATSKEGGNYEFDIEKTFIIEPAGPTELLLAKATTSGDTTIVYTWNKISEADGYEFYMSKCNANGKKYEVKLIKTIKGNKTFKFTKKNLKKGVAYKAKVMAYKMIGKKKVYLSESPMVHAYAGGKSKTETNAKTLTLKTTKFSLKKGKTGTIKATVTKAYSKLTLLAHTEKLRYYSSDTSIATVSDKGVITARGKGTCTIAVLTHNGICKKVKVTVK